MDKRIRFIFSIFCIWFIIVGIRLWHLQVINYEYYKGLSLRNRIRTVRIPASRGRIFDRNGILLADSQAIMQVAIIVRSVANREELAEKLSPIINLKTEYIIKKIKENIFRPFMPVVFANGLVEEAVMHVAEARHKFPGVSVEAKPARDYLFSEVTSHILGYVGEVTKDELANGYELNDVTGKSGIEKAYDIELQGGYGKREIQVDYRGNIDKVINVIEPSRGRDLFLTIDMELQEILYNAIGKYHGAGIAISPKTGEVISMASRPGYNPNAFIAPVEEEVVAKIFRDSQRPLINRSIQGLYPPGSVFKPIVALAGLSKGVVNKDTLFFCDGKFTSGKTEFGCWEKHGWQDLRNAIKKSCNEYFYQTGLKSGKEKIVDMAKRFGLGKATGINLREEKKGLLPDNLTKWYPGDTVNLSIGHGDILVTPIQIACMICAVANQGFYYRPKLVMGEESECTAVDVDKEHLELVRQGLLKVVKEPDGTGARAHVEGLDIAGKTGTVELIRGRNINWFVGFAPFDEPEIVVVVVIEGGESGGVTAAPVAQKVFGKWKEMNMKLLNDK